MHKFAKSLLQLLFATELGVRPVKPQLSPDSSAANTHLCGRANCQAKWGSRLILQGGLNYPAATEKAPVTAEIFTEAFMCQLGFSCALACLHLCSVTFSPTASASSCTESPSLSSIPDTRQILQFLGVFGKSLNLHKDLLVHRTIDTYIAPPWSSVQTGVPAPQSNVWKCAEVGISETVGDP